MFIPQMQNATGFREQCLQRVLQQAIAISEIHFHSSPGKQTALQIIDVSSVILLLYNQMRQSEHHCGPNRWLEIFHAQFSGLTCLLVRNLLVGHLTQEIWHGVRTSDSPLSHVPPKPCSALSRKPSNKRTLPSCFHLAGEAMRIRRTFLGLG